MKNLKEQSPLEAKIKRLEKELENVKDKEQQYRHLFEKSPIMIYAIDRKGKFLNINQAGVELMGYDSADEIIGNKFQDFFFKDLNEFQTYEKKIHTHDVITEFTTQMKKKTGVYWS